MVRTYSGGMIRRLELAQAMLHRPTVLFLDEPTVGLDPIARAAVWEHVRRLRDREGATILLTTHYMEEAFQICDRVLIMDKGSRVLEDNPHKLLAENIEAYVMEVPVTNGTPVIPESDLPEDVRLDRTEGTMRFYADQIDHLKTIADRLSGNHYYLRQSTLEDVFLKATGRVLNEKQ